MGSLNNDTSNLPSYGPPTKSGKIPFNPPGTDRKCETAYWVWGDLTSTTPPLIVVHGGPGAPGRDWKVVSRIHEKYGIPYVLYDTIGCGDSTHLPETKGDTSFWTTDLFLAELDNLRKFLQIETFDLLGHSDGGLIIVPYALTQPQGLRKLIIASSTGSDALRVEARLRLRKQLPQELQDTLTAGEAEGNTKSDEYQAAEKEWMLRNFCRLNPWPPVLDEVMALCAQDMTIPHTLYGPDTLNPTGPRKGFSFVGQLHAITEKTAPGGVLLTNGRYDMNQDPCMAVFFNEIRARVKWVRFAESAHFPHLEEPEAFLIALADFLQMP